MPEDTPNFEETAAETDAVKVESSKQNPNKNGQTDTRAIVDSAAASATVNKDGKSKGSSNTLLCEEEQKANTNYIELGSMQNCKANEFIEDADNPRDKKRTDSRHQNTGQFKETRAK